MAILIGLVLAAVVLFLWLAGTWFGRVLAFLLLAAILGLLIGGLMPPPQGAVYNWGGLIFGMVLAWPVSGLPRYLARRAARREVSAIYPPIIRLN